MSKIETLSGEYTLEEAKANENNLLQKFDYLPKMYELYSHFHDRGSLIEGRVAQHLGIRPQSCHITHPSRWMKGSFNLCVVLTIDNWSHARSGAAETQIIMRFPVPFRVGEHFRPGNADEKLRCEAGAYAWLQQNCATTVPIPQLYGFALSTGQQFTALEYLPFWTRCIYSLRRRVSSWLGHPPSTHYIRHQAPLYSRLLSWLPYLSQSTAQGKSEDDLGSGYLLLEYVDSDQGRMLSDTWREEAEDDTKRTNLFRNLSRILLSLCRIPLPRIGSFRIDDMGNLSLTNRPLTFETMAWENQRVPLDIPRDLTYTFVDSYINDVLHIHERRLLHQPNAVNNERDCGYQMEALTVGRQIIPQLFRRDLRQGPFVLNFTDLHASNIFVDENWNITKLIDLEFVCSLPIEFHQPPHWLSDQAVDCIQIGKYDKIRKEFMEILVAEETSLGSQNYNLSSIMEQGWASGTFWAEMALTSVTGFYALVCNRILPLRSLDDQEMSTDAHKVLTQLWGPEYSIVCERKVNEKREYDRLLEEAFSKAEVESAS